MILGMPIDYVYYFIGIVYCFKFLWSNVHISFVTFKSKYFVSKLEG